MGEHKPGYPMLAGLPGNLQRRHVPASPAREPDRTVPARRVGEQQVRPGHPGREGADLQAHTAEAVSRRGRYPHVGWLMWAPGRGSITRSATQTAATAGCGPRAVPSARNSRRGSLRRSQASQAAGGPPASAPRRTARPASELSVSPPRRPGQSETVQDHIERLRRPPVYAPARHLVPALLPLHLPAATSAAPSCGWSPRRLARS